MLEFAKSIPSGGMTAKSTCAALGLGIFTLAAPAAHGADPQGIWRTQADRKGQVADVAATRCGSYFCGTIQRVYDANGNTVQAPTLGTLVFWNMRQQGSEFAGRAYVPAHNREYEATMKVNGDTMTVQGCLGPVCQSQIWTRVY